MADLSVRISGDELIVGNLNLLIFRGTSAIQKVSHIRASVSPWEKPRIVAVRGADRGDIFLTRRFAFTHS